MSATPLHLFEGIGIEIEYMLVDRQTGDVMPAVDRLLAAEAGSIVSDLERGELAWSNELVLHVVELKTNGPATALEPLVDSFARDIRWLDTLARSLGGRLLGTAMHPWMDPLTETRLWPHDFSPVYQAFDRIFGCRGHGWSNVQSLHINLPFANDDEFGRLHAAIRLLLPLMPALAASSPLVGGKATGILDNRMSFYRTNTARIPSVTGLVIPEPAFSRDAYDHMVLQPMYRDIAPHDPDSQLQEPFLNARGAIARFDRGSIEIRVIDVQECPRADLAIAFAVVEVLRLLVEERWCDYEDQQSWPQELLSGILRRTAADGERASIHETEFLEAFGAEGTTMSAGALWRHLVDEVYAHHPDTEAPWDDTLEILLERGPLARRILRAVGDDPDRARLAEVYGRLADCLLENRLFDA